VSGSASRARRSSRAPPASGTRAATRHGQRPALAVQDGLDVFQAQFGRRAHLIHPAQRGVKESDPGLGQQPPQNGRVSGALRAVQVQGLAQQAQAPVRQTVQRQIHAADPQVQQSPMPRQDGPPLQPRARFGDDEQIAAVGGPQTRAPHIEFGIPAMPADLDGAQRDLDAQRLRQARVDAGAPGVDLRQHGVPQGQQTDPQAEIQADGDREKPASPGGAMA